MSRIVLGIGASLALAVVLAQVFLPSLAAKRVSDRVARYGTVKSVSVSAFPALELLWGRVDSASVSAGTLSVSSAQVASLLWEARDVERLTITADAVTLRVPALPSGLTLSDVRMHKQGSTIQASATLTQKQLNEAVPSGFHVEPIASGSGQVEARASGGLFGVQASITALVRPFEGRLIAEPRGIPFASLATVTLFSDPHLQVQSVGVSVERTQPLIYSLSLRASLR